MNYYGVFPEEKRIKLLNSDVAKPFIDEIIVSADTAICERDYSFKMSDYMLYYKTGNRKIFQNPYFERRRKCNNIMLAYWLTQDEKYLEPLIDYIMYICGEITWCIPAHCDFINSTANESLEWIDLFQSETARFFAEIVMCVGDKLPNFVLQRMKYEIHRRIFPTLEKGDKYWWESCKMNWAVVCGAGCTMAALYFGDEEDKDSYIKRFIGCLDSYLEGIGNDGCCQEGVSYWNYGFGHFVILAQIIKVYTSGEIDYFKNPKVKELALFLQRVRMSDSIVASISDCKQPFIFKIGMLSFLKSVYEEVLLPDIKYGTLKGNVDSVCELLWFDENYKSEKLGLETVYLSDSQWYISHREKYSFVAKGGHNKEPHNHNDIGSFMITVGEETFISDLGHGEYVKDTFRPETRYNFLQNSSRGHSVPIINGKYQMPGEEFCSKDNKADDDSFELDIAGAYAEELVKGIKRSFRVCEDKIILTDVFDCADNVKITERFVSKIEPKVYEEYIDFGVGKIAFDSKKYIPSVITDNFVAPNGIDNVTVYLIDFVSVKKDDKEYRFEFLIN